MSSLSLMCQKAGHLTVRKCQRLGSVLTKWVIIFLGSKPFCETYSFQIFVFNKMEKGSPGIWQLLSHYGKNLMMDKHVYCGMFWRPSYNWHCDKKALHSRIFIYQCLNLYEWKQENQYCLMLSCYSRRSHCSMDTLTILSKQLFISLRITFPITVLYYIL